MSPPTIKKRTTVDTWQRRRGKKFGWMLAVRLELRERESAPRFVLCCSCDHLPFLPSFYPSSTPFPDTRIEAKQKIGALTILLCENVDFSQLEIFLDVIFPSIDSRAIWDRYSSSTCNSVSELPSATIMWRRSNKRLDPLNVITREPDQAEVGCWPLLTALLGMHPTIGVWRVWRGESEEDQLKI